MGGLYGSIVLLHNIVGSLTLLLTLAGAAMLLITARTTGGTALALRANLISASLQFMLGVLLVVLGLVRGSAAYIVGLWPHYLLGIVTVAAVSAAVARARRAPDSAARRFGGILLAVVLLVLLTFLVGQYLSA